MGCHRLVVPVQSRRLLLCRRCALSASKCAQSHLQHAHVWLLLRLQAVTATAEGPAGSDGGGALRAEVAGEQGGCAGAGGRRGTSQQTMDILHLLASLDFTQSSNGSSAGEGLQLHIISLIRWQCAYQKSI